MRRFRRIAVGLDLAPGEDRLSDGGALALAWAGWLAAGDDAARVSLVHSTAADEDWDPVSGSYVSERLPTPDAVLEEALASLRDAGVEARLIRSPERAWLALVHHVLAEQIDLVLVGKRASHFLEGPLLGSVSTKLVRKCPGAVAVMKPGAPPPPPRVLLAAVDASPVGDRVLEAAAALVERSGAELHVVHTFQRTMSVQLGTEQAAHEFEVRTRERSRARLRERIAAAGGPDDAKLHVALSSPTHAVLECARLQRPDLVLMGTMARGGIPGLLLGNTAERLVARLDPSLLVVKPADFVCPVAPGPPL